MSEDADTLLDAIVANAPVALGLYDRDLELVRANTAFADLDPDLAAVERVLKTGESVRGAIEYHRVTSEFVLVTAAPHAEQAVEQLTRLQSITALLSGTRTREEVCTILVNQGLAGVGATSAVLCLVTDDGTEMEIAHSVGLQAETAQNWQRFPIDAPVPASDAVRTGKPIMFSTLEDRDRLYPLFKGQPTTNQAYATLPLRVTSRSIGSVTFGWHDPRSFTTGDHRFLSALAEQSAQALDRCRLYEVEARELRRKEFMAEASALLASSLDYQTTIERVARLLVPEMADACRGARGDDRRSGAGDGGPRRPEP